MTREELHRLVWSKPMTHVAQQFGVSGSYLARVCSVLKVPRPERGYWAKLAVGVASPTKVLPQPEPGHPLEWSKETGFGPSGGDTPAGPRQRFKQFPRLRAKQTIPETHPLIAGARQHFENSRPNDSLLHKYGEQYLRPFKKVLVDITVTKSALTGALTLTNSLFNALESDGYHVVLANARSLHHREPELREVPSKQPQTIHPTRWKPRDPTVVYAEGATIGLAVVEMSEEVELRYMGDGKYIKESEYRPPKRPQSRDYTWTTTQDVPTGRFRIVAYSPYDRVAWSTHWQESQKSSLLDQIRAIVSAMKGIAGELTTRKAEADAAFERQRQEWREEEERRRRTEDKERIEASRKTSAQALEHTIEAWAIALNRETFFQRLELRAADLPPAQQDEVRNRIALARAFIGTQDPLEYFLKWKTPTEIYTPRYEENIVGDSDDSEE